MTDQELFAYTQERGRVLNEVTRHNKYHARDAEEPADTLLREAMRHFLHDVYNKAMLARDKYGFHPMGWATPDWQEELQKGIAEHVQKGDPRDVAVYAMFAWFHGWSTATPAPSLLVGGEGQPAPLTDAALAELEELRESIGMFQFGEGDFAKYLPKHLRPYATAACNALPGLLARLRAAEAAASGVSSPGGEAGGWISCEALPVLPEDCPQEYWVAYSDGSVGQLWWAYRATMDENWDEDEPYTGWMFEDMSDGLNIYNGPQPLYYKEMEPAPLAPAELLKGGQQDA